MAKTRFSRCIQAIDARGVGRRGQSLVRGAVLIEEPEHPYLDLELNSPLDQLKSPPQCDIESRWGRRPGARP